MQQTNLLLLFSPTSSIPTPPVGTKIRVSVGLSSVEIRVTVGLVDTEIRITSPL